MQQNRAENRRPPQYMTEVVQKFDDNKFNFTKITAEKELIFSLKNKDIESGWLDKIIINVSPVNEYHSLLVPQADLKLPQVLTEYSLNLALEVMFLSTDKNMRLCFNSLCAYASVNHLHWHIIYLQENLYIQDAKLEETKVKNLYLLSPEVYPAPCFVFTINKPESINSTARKVFEVIEYFLRNNIAHNVYISRGQDPERKENCECIRIFVWARESVVGAKKSDSFVIAVLELAGQILVFKPEMYESIEEDEISQAQELTVLPVFKRIKDEVIQLLATN